MAARQAGEAQLRFRQDKGKGKLFTLTRRLGSPKHSSTNGEKKGPNVWEVEEPASVNCLCF